MSEPNDREQTVPKPETEGYISSKGAKTFQPTTRFYLTFLALSIVTLAAAIDATSLSIAIPTITTALGGTAIEAFWSGTSFLLTSTALQPTYTALSHSFGRKPLLLIASIFFFAGSLIAALAGNYTILILGRAVQGVGGSGILCLGEIIVIDLVPLNVRGQWLGIIGAMWALGSVTGPLLGGGFAQKVSWRWIFYINLPMIGLGVALVIVFLRQTKVPGSVKEKLLKFDWVGTVVFIASITSILIPLTWGGVSYPWSSWHTLVPLILGFAGVLAFFVYEARLTNIEPMIPPSVYQNWTLRVAYIQTVMHGMVLWSLLYYLPLYYEAVKGYGPITTGVAVLPETFMVAPFSIITAILITKTGSYRWAVWIGWILTTFGAGLLYLLDVETTVAQWIFLNLVVSIGTGILFPAISFIVQAAIDQKDATFSVTMSVFLRTFGQCLGVAIGGVIFQNQIKSNLLAIPDFASLASQYSKDATELVSIINAMTAGDDRTQLVQAYADSLKTVWAVMCGLAGLGLLSSLFTKAYTLEQEHVTRQGLAEGGRTSDAESDLGRQEKPGSASSSSGNL